MKLRVIIFDDEAAILLPMALLVRSRGHEVLTYNQPTLCPLYTYPACICTRNEACADILITDNNMPVMTGLEFVRQQALRGCKGIARNKAVMSGEWESEDVELAESLGCKIFFKPLDADDFLAWLDTCAASISADRKLVEFRA